MTTTHPNPATAELRKLLDSVAELEPEGPDATYDMFALVLLENRRLVEETMSEFFVKLHLHRAHIRGKRGVA